jgi:adenylate cyclase
VPLRRKRSAGSADSAVQRTATPPDAEPDRRPRRPTQRQLSQKLAGLIETNPAVRDMAVEVGIVDPHWLEQPSKRKPAIAPPGDMARRLIERVADSQPSALGGLGVNALQLLSWDLFWNRTPLPARDSVSVATVVFTDLEGFTSYTATFGDDAALTLLSEHHRATARVIRKWGGRVVKRLGDGLMLVFSDASSAVFAALDMVPLSPDPLRMRAGIHTGELVVTADDLIGNVVNVAARVTDDARGGQVLVTDDVLAASGELLGVRIFRGKRRLYKGVAQRVTVSRVERA